MIQTALTTPNELMPYPTTPTDPDHPRIRAVLTELGRIISHHYPDATFTVVVGDDPDGVYLRPIVNVDDLDDVIEPILDTLYAIQVEQGLPIFVFPRHRAT